mmetsp:Transcript_12624/g.24486  ORF Transcript_12624/g.24486 Transcript_12624/m.24486 type:complete len:164 (-) Transcript_12624:204-695(-)
MFSNARLIARTQVGRRFKATATTTAGRNTDKVPAAGQGEGGHPNVMAKGSGTSSSNGTQLLGGIMALTLAYAGYQFFVAEPTKGAEKYQFNEATGAEHAEEATQHRLQHQGSAMRSKGPFGSKNREFLGITPSDEQLESQAVSHSAAGTVASAAARDGKAPEQ